VQNLFSLGHGETVVGGWLHKYRREPEIVRTHAETTITLAEEYGFPEWRVWGIFNRGWARAELGEVEKGVAEMEEGIAGFAPLGGVPGKQFALALLAHGYQRLSRHDQALAIFDQALAHVGRSGEMFETAEILRLKGELLLARDGLPDAERCFRAAIELAREQKARWWELRATVSLARLLAKQGKRDEARAMLADIYNWFTEGFETADLKDAKALLDELPRSLSE
jgi:adenylate cyclase